MHLFVFLILILSDCIIFSQTAFGVGVLRRNHTDPSELSVCLQVLANWLFRLFRPDRFGIRYLGGDLSQTAIAYYRHGGLSPPWRWMRFSRSHDAANLLARSLSKRPLQTTTDHSSFPILSPRWSVASTPLRRPFIVFFQR